MLKIHEWRVRALTEISPVNLLRAIRWHAKHVVRDWGGEPCDPSGTMRCPDENGRHCVVCELFGCSGWARKFRLVQSGVIEAGTEFTIRILDMRMMNQYEVIILDRAIERIGTNPTGDEISIDVIARPSLPTIGLDELRSYIGDERWRNVPRRAVSS